MDIDALQRTAVKAAYDAGKVLMHHFGHLEKVTKKGAIDLVTAADIESERLIIETLRSVYPDHAILAEESGHQPGTTDSLWIIDPLDGTTNFAHNLPIFSVSIAFYHDGRPLIGIVFNPVSAELFTAVKNRGAHLNQQSISVSSVGEMTDSLLVTGFAYSQNQCDSPAVKRFGRCLQASQGVRRLGSAALDLCFVAAGRFEGFWEAGLNPWDTAAGVLLVTEAGGKVTDYTGQDFDIHTKHLLATNGIIHDGLMVLLEKEESR